MRERLATEAKGASRGLRRGAAALLLLAASFTYGFLCARHKVFPYALLARGYHVIAGARGASSPPVDPIATSLATVPYLQGYNLATGRHDVTTHDRGRAYEGLNLFTSGHAPLAFLMDMDGRILHEWRYDFQRAFPGRFVENHSGDLYWRRVHLFPNGDLLAIFEGLGLVKLDAGSRLLWAYAGGCHHDLSVGRDGSVHVLTREPTVFKGQRVFEDHVTELDPGGQPVAHTSILQCLLHSDYAALLGALPAKGDLFHTNRLAILEAVPGARAPFEEGRALISSPLLGVVALLDLREERTVWALTGLWRRQHDPTLLPGGRLLVFDNFWDEAGRRSRVVEIDPLSQQVVWDYGNGKGESFFSAWLGECQRLPNGNTLIVESTAGRAFEVTPARRIVWEFVSPFRAGDREELVATLVQMRRLPPDFPFRGSRPHPLYSR